MANYAETLKAAMRAKDITAAELAELSGVTAASIGNYCSGKYAPKPKTSQKLAAALGLEDNRDTETPFIFSVQKITLRQAARVMHMKERTLVARIRDGVYDFADVYDGGVYIRPKQFYEYTGWRF